MNGAQRDVLALAPPSTPNWHLAAPEGIRDDVAGTRSAFYPIAAMPLRTNFRNILLAQPRTACLYQAQSEQEADIYEQRSRIFGFKDVIQVWCLHQNEEPSCSGLVIYSRALTGYYDFGVNRRRVRHLLAESMSIFSIIYIMRKISRRRGIPLAPVIALFAGTMMLFTHPAPAKTELELPGIIGTDNREPIDSSAWPWSSIGRVNRTAGGFCTGTLIAPRLVLTAAHCMFDSRNGRSLAAKEVHFVAGYRKDHYLAHSIARSIHVADGFQYGISDGEALSNDWALIELVNTIPLKPLPVHDFTREGSSLKLPKNSNILRAGYSQDRAHLLAADRNCAIEGTAENGRILLHDCDATRGDSGSALLLKSQDGGYQILGVSVAIRKYGNRNYGVAVPSVNFREQLSTRHLLP